jgi:dTDP-4-dehydrorhamnose 3,5-epimerase-like enzyme
MCQSAGTIASFWGGGLFVRHVSGWPNKTVNKSDKDLWMGLSKSARAALVPRDYKQGSLAERLAGPGLDAGELAGVDLSKRDMSQVWIPGVEIFPRKIHAQPHRGLFGEFARQEEGIPAKIGFWPKQWAAARMFAHSAKGFHVHPPSIPTNTTPAEWHRRLFEDEPDHYKLRRYDHEQWDMMFFVQGRLEMILRDVRDGLPPRTMRFYTDGDNHRGGNNVGVVVPPGVAHALRAEGSEDVIMVYGTSTSFHPEFEGRIASDVEAADLPESWQRFLGDK